MLKTLQTVAVRLYPFRWLVYVAGVICAGFLVYVFLFLQQQDQDDYLIPCYIFITWTLIYSILTSMFRHTPAVATPVDGLFTRTRLNLVRAFYYLLAVGFLLLTGATILLSLKVLNIWWLSNAS